MGPAILQYLVHNADYTVIYSIYIYKYIYKLHIAENFMKNVFYSYNETLLYFNSEQAVRI